MESILKVKDLCKTYIVNKRQNNVLRNVSFEVGKGEMVAVMGPSGSGKSTLLYTVSGMDTPTSGEVDFCGSDIVKMNQPIEGIPLLSHADVMLESYTSYLPENSSAMVA